ncbi:Pkinase domain-containing protein [Cephalotus follicularis]|uniref:Pkinase domain-containing protein n=1 Tax=Cephalotus follicularis TaxID=3775 RepID=A0A1Q3DBK0_CEPFO|nr:Pkinase domain-containing protein [Cephalotus follicularis]
MEWTRGHTIGRGSTATVSLATAIPSGNLFAVKSTELSHSMFLQREQLFLSNLSYPYIVKYIGFDITNENGKPTYNLCMEYVPGGTLYNAIQMHGGRLGEPMIRSFTNQILQGVHHLHVNGLAHCDIKSQNVLIGEHGGAKIADLGCAKLVGNGGSARSAISGTPAFMAPEVARGELQGFEADIWAVGCTVIEMAIGTNPWPEISDPVSALYRIGFSGEMPEIPIWLS